MNPKVICLFVLIAAACSAEEIKPERYPANVDPLLCPGYPHCDNALLHGTEKISVLPSVQKTVVPGYRYYTVNELTHLADPYLPASRILLSPSTAPVLRYATAPDYRYAPASILRVASSPWDVKTDAPLLSVVPIAPNKVETITGGAIAPIAPFATLPGIASKLLVARS